jgi:hypothetical protein
VGRGKAGHDAIRRHIIKRAKALGAMNLIPDNWSSSGSNESEVRLGDVTEYFGDGNDAVAGFCIDAYSGPLCVSIRGNVPPDQLRAAATAAACAAMDAINCMDPDNDADIDSGIEGMDDGMESKSGASSSDDDMADKYSESAVKAELESRRDGNLWTDEKIRALVSQMLKERAAAYGLIAKEMDTGPSDDGHSVSDESDTNMTSPSETAETAQENETKEESAMGDTQEVAAEAAPQTTLTSEDMKLLGETIGNTMAEALKAFAEMNTPKHAAAPQETTEKVEDVAESAPEAATPKADDLAALKESLANELRRDLRNELRAEILEEKGLPPRRGYRLTENDEPEEMTDAELFNKHRMDILLGNYGLAAPAADATQAA